MKLTVENTKRKEVIKVGNMNKKYSCPNPECLTSFDFPSLLINHLATSHNNPQYLRNFISIKEDKSRACVFCGKGFGTPGGAQMHVAKHHASVTKNGILEINMDNTVPSHFLEVVINSGPAPVLNPNVDGENVSGLRKHCYKGKCL